MFLYLIFPDQIIVMLIAVAITIKITSMSALPFVVFEEVSVHEKAEAQSGKEDCPRPHSARILGSLPAEPIF